MFFSPMLGGGNGGFNVYKYHYPKSRTAMAKDNVPVGVAGTVELLNSKVNIFAMITRDGLKPVLSGV